MKFKICFCDRVCKDNMKQTIILEDVKLTITEGGFITFVGKDDIPLLILPGTALKCVEYVKE
jgi:hypothetical protein